MEKFLFELFVRGLVLCLLAVLTLVLFRRAAAAYRHLICVLALCSLLALPWAQRLLPSLRLLPPQTAVAPRRIAALPQSAGQFTDLSPKSDWPASQDAPPETDKGRKPSDLLPTGREAAVHHRTALPSSLSLQRSRQASTLLLTSWGIGAATLLIRLLVALSRLRRLKAQSHPTLREGVPILVSERIPTPLTWGIRSPIILLPTVLLSGDPAVCATAIRHEQAHIARWDWTWNLLAELVCALCWFQPGVWWLRARMRLESERACDDRVLLSGIAGPDYAAHLLEIVRTVSTTELAPAMAQSGTMEERMRHILDDAKPRHTQTRWLTVSALVATALLSLSTLRVSARPAQQEKPSQVLSIPLRKQEKPQPVLPLPLREIVWGKAVDGLQPGFWLTRPGFPNNRRIPGNSLASYRVMVRNTTNKNIEFLVQVVSYEDADAPYLIPNDNIREALDGREVPEKFRAKCPPHNLDGADPAYVVTLAPGEMVLMLDPLGLFLGEEDKEGYPSMAKFKEGRSWIVQPITIHSLTPAEIADARAREMRVKLTIASRNGTAAQSSMGMLLARDGGKRLYAKIPIEIGAANMTPVTSIDKVFGDIPSTVASPLSVGPTQEAGSTGNAAETQVSAQPPASAAAATAQHKDAATPQIPGPIVWGPGRDIQAGLALWNRYGNPDQHTGLYVFNVYLRNRTKQTLKVDCPSFGGLSVPGDDTDYTTMIQSPMIYCSPQIRDSAGKPVDVSIRPGEEHEQYTLKPGQVVLVSHWMLRTMKPEAKDATRSKYTQVAFVEPGQFHVQCAVNVSLGNKAERRSLSTGDVPFEVTSNDVGR